MHQANSTQSTDVHVVIRRLRCDVLVNLSVFVVSKIPLFSRLFVWVSPAVFHSLFDLFAQLYKPSERKTSWF